MRGIPPHTCKIGVLDVAELKCWYCKEVILDKEDMVVEKVKNINRKFHKHKNCLTEFNKQNELSEKLKLEREKEKEEWHKLYEYVKKDILGYSDNMKLSNYARNSLQSLRNGTLVTRNQKMVNRGYPYHIILMTFNIKKMDIDRALATKSFDTENKKFNYIMAIINNSINDVYMRYLSKNKKESMIEKQIEPTVERPSTKVEYIRKSEINKKGSLFDDIW